MSECLNPKQVTDIIDKRIKEADKQKPLSRNEVGFRNYLIKYHYNKYIEYISKYYFGDETK